MLEPTPFAVQPSDREVSYYSSCSPAFGKPPVAAARHAGGDTVQLGVEFVVGREVVVSLQHYARQFNSGCQFR